MDLNYYDPDPYYPGWSPYGPGISNPLADPFGGPTPTNGGGQQDLPWWQQAILGIIGVAARYVDQDDDDGPTYGGGGGGTYYPPGSAPGVAALVPYLLIGILLFLVVRAL